MAFFKFFFSIALGILALTDVVYSNCAVCSRKNYAACLNETAFSVCYDGENPSTEIQVCAEGLICTSEQGVCKPKGDAILGCSLVGCNQCSGLFACVSQTQFAYCDESGIKGVIGSCQNGDYCSINFFNNEQTICSPACNIYDNPPTCQNTEVITEAPPVDQWKNTCIKGKSKGYYQNILDSTCKTYVYCEELDGIMNAIFYTCSSGYFDQGTQKCGTAKPSNCK